MSHSPDQQPPISMREMEQRVARLEDDELAAARKLYNHARWMVSLFIVFITVIFATVAFIQMSQSNTYFQQIEAMLEQGREDIARLTGGAGFNDYRIDGEFLEGNLQLYYTPGVQAGESDGVPGLAFRARTVLYSVDDRVGELVSASIEWDHEELVEVVLAGMEEHNPLLFRALKREVSVPLVVEKSAAVGQRVGVIMPMNYEATFRDCAQYDRFIEFARSDPPHFEAIFTPLFANAAGPSESTRLSIELVETVPFPDCTLPQPFSVRELMEEDETAQ